MAQLYYKTLGGSLVPAGGYVINDTTKVSLSGNETVAGDKTFTGLTQLTNNLTMTRDWPSFVLNGSKAGSTVKGGSIYWQSATSNRWIMGATDDAESGTNAGSNFYLSRRDDTGNYLGNPLTIERSTGNVTFEKTVKLSAPITISTNSLNIGTGSYSADGAIHAVHDANMIVYLGSSGSYIPRIRGLRTAGTFASKSAIAQSAELLNIEALAYGTSSFKTASGIKLMTDAGTISDTSMPGRISFYTVPDGTVTFTERMRISETGKVSIYSATNGLEFGSSGPRIMTGSAHPDTSISAPIGSSLYNTANGMKYDKVEGTGNTGWAPAGSVALDNAQSGTSYYLISSDIGKVVTTTSSSTVTVYLPTTNPVVGAMITVVQLGTGQVQFNANGKTCYYTPGYKLRAQYSSATVWQRSAGVWVIMGDLVA